MVARVTGHRETARAFRELARLVAGPGNQASKRALEPMLEEAKANLDRNRSVHTGKLKKALTIKREPRAPKTKPTYRIGATSESGQSGTVHLVEFGTAPHKIGSVEHPGAQPKPFMRPAYETKKAEAVDIFNREFGPAVEKQAAKLAAKKASR